MFELDRFVEDCRRAIGETDPRAAMKDVVERAVSDPAAVLDALGEPTRAEAVTVYHADDLTILRLVWGPDMKIFPHDHRMWAVIGMYGGREDNTFFRRETEGLVRHGTKVLEPGDVASLGENAIHAVHNPLSTLAPALHVYGGDFFNTPRSEWDAETLEEQPYSVQHTMQLFEEANERLQAQAG